MSDRQRGEVFVPSDEDVERVFRIRGEQTSKLLSLPNVESVAVGLRHREGRLLDELCVVVFVGEKVPASDLSGQDVVPERLVGDDGSSVAVDVVQSVLFDPLSAEPERYRPLMAGCSIGRDDDPAGVTSIGSAGGFVVDVTDGSVVLLTCNHVVTLSDDYWTLPTCEIIQPSSYLGGKATDGIGKVKRLLPLRVSSTPVDVPLNRADAAIVRLSSPADFSPAHRGGGGEYVYKMRSPRIGELVNMYGASTREWRTGRVATVDHEAKMQYGTDDKPLYARVGPCCTVDPYITTRPFGQGGDSGSIVCVPGPIEEEQAVVGLFIGGKAEGGVGIITDITTVAAELNLAPLSMMPDTRLWYRLKGRNQFSDPWRYIGADSALWLRADGRGPSDGMEFCFLPYGEGSKYVIVSNDIPNVWTVEKDAFGVKAWGRLGIRSSSGPDRSTFRLQSELLDGRHHVRIYEPTTGYVEMMGVEPGRGIIRWSTADDASQHFTFEPSRSVTHEERRELDKILT